MKSYKAASGINWELTLESFLTREEINQLRSWAIKRRDKCGDHRLFWIEWFLIEILINTGLRVFELTDLQCRDIRFRGELSCVVVRNGKCNKYREIIINKLCQAAIREFLAWKNRVGEDISDFAPLFYSPKSKDCYSTRALQIAFKRCLMGAEIKSDHSIHHMRHTYASLLLKASGNNMPLCQKQLGHSQITTTAVYTKVFIEEIVNSVERLL